MTSTHFSKRQELLLVVFLVGMTFSNAVAAVKLLPLLRNGYQDFTIFYAAARMVRGGQSHALYDLSAQYRAQREFAPNVPIRQAALPYNHPPFEALGFVPFTFLPYLAAYVLWTSLSLTMILCSVTLLRRQYVGIAEIPLWVLTLAAFGFPPIAHAMIQGQDSILLLFLFVLALVAMERGWDAIAGAALAAGLFKFHLVLPLVFLLIVGMRRWRLLLGFAPFAAVLAGISIALVGFSGCIAYVRFLTQLENTGAGGAIVGIDMPNLRGIIATLFDGHNGRALLPVVFVGSAAAVALAWWWMNRIRESDDRVASAFVLATVATILVSYHTLTYDLSLLLPVMLLLLAARGSKPDPRTEINLLLILYLAPLLEVAWPGLNQFAWPLVILMWFFWKTGNGRAVNYASFASSSAS